ncbi:MAG TPA: class I adenylate-forming enzyme family protein [Solirubrobacteraceae bacterium]|jgi:long-chain acyl-CoA synthetase|nr:class I adenylate-forming enzyme family protein [Solirubrobacteraceae bacterium]
MSATPHRLHTKPEPYRPVTYLEANAEAHPRRAAIIEREQEISFFALLEWVRQLMHLLRARVEPGEVVAVALPNVATYVALEIGIPAIGAVIMPLPPALGAHEISSALHESGAVLVVTTSAGEVAERAAKQSSAVREILTLPLVVDEGAGGVRAEPVATQRDDIVQIALTSGTTGTPKLAAYTAELKQLTFEGFTARLRIDPSDRVLPLSPITQGAGEMFLYCLRRGASLVMLGEHRFRAQDALTLTQQSMATVVGGVPTMLARMDRARMEDVDLSSLRLTAVAGAPLPPSLARAWEEQIGAPVVSFYGAMDIGQLAVPSPDDPAEKRWHTVGRPHDHAEWAILDPRGAELPVGSEGEVCMRGPLVQPRYWNQETGPYAQDGWAHFGDLGFIDEDGYLHVTGRLKDTIIRGGNNINPYEVEEIIRRHPAVADVTVVGRPDPDLGERTVAFVVFHSSSQLELEDLTSFLDQRGLARYKWPEALHQVDQLPLGPTGKLLRGELRERAVREYEAGHESEEDAGKNQRHRYGMV